MEGECVGSVNAIPVITAMLANMTDVQKAENSRTWII
jgi:hypothetical protein